MYEHCISGWIACIAVTSIDKVEGSCELLSIDLSAEAWKEAILMCQKLPCDAEDAEKTTSRFGMNQFEKMVHKEIIEED